MKRERDRAHAQAPHHLLDLNPVLRDYPPTREICQGIVQAADGTEALLFAGAIMIERVSNATEIFVDPVIHVSVTQHFEMTRHRNARCHARPSRDTDS